MKKFFRSLKCALNGLKIVSLEERNFQIHIVLGAAAIILGLALDVTRVEMMLIVVAVVFALASEAINTALEDLCDMVRPNPDPLIGKIKDISAGFVLISVLGALALGAMIFLPYL